MNKFYNSGSSNYLRFGDVVRGYLFTDLTINGPVLDYPSNKNTYKLDIQIPNFSVILTPCCSIEKGVICISPLIHVQSSFFKNPKFFEDLTNINRQLLPQETVNEEDWKKFPVDRKDKMNSEGKQYTLLQYFIYDEHEYFDKYEVRGREISYYMIDFKNIQKIKCNKLNRIELDSEIQMSKILELSIEARQELREKLSYFYWRIPEEDIIDY